MFVQFAFGTIGNSSFECFDTTVFVEVQVSADRLDVATCQFADLSGLQSFGFQVNSIASLPSDQDGKIADNAIRQCRR